MIEYLHSNSVSPPEGVVDLTLVRSMRCRTIRVFFLLILLLRAAHQLPAQSQDVQESPTPISTPAVSLPKSKSSDRSKKEQKHLSGSIANHGTSSVNATGTPLGRYQKVVYDAIGARWYQNVEKRRDVISKGRARASFWIDRYGRVTNLKVIQNTSNETFANICLQSILEIKLPPIPKGVADILPPKGLETQISFAIL